MKAGSLSVSMARPRSSAAKRSIRRSSAASTLRTGPIRSKLRTSMQRPVVWRHGRLRAVHEDRDLVSLAIADDWLAVEADPAMRGYPVAGDRRPIDGKMQFGRITRPAQELETQKPLAKTAPVAHQPRMANRLAHTPRNVLHRQSGIVDVAAGRSRRQDLLEGFPRDAPRQRPRAANQRLMRNRQAVRKPTSGAEPVMCCR